MIGVIFYNKRVCKLWNAYFANMFGTRFISISILVKSILTVISLYMHIKAIRRWRAQFFPIKVRQHYCKHPSYRTSVSTLSLDRPLECSSSRSTSSDGKHARKQRYPNEAMGMCRKYPIYGRYRPLSLCVS